MSAKSDKYLNVAKTISGFSKDSSTQVGALIIGQGGEFIASGWNGAPRGCAADEAGDSRSVRPEKYFWFSHAEVNAITNAARVGTPLAGGQIVVTHFPCMDCARAIVQAGLVKVLAPRPDAAFLERWGEHVQRSLVLFTECGVEIEWVNNHDQENQT